VALRQATKAIENVVGAKHRLADLALEAIPIGRRRGGESVEIALASRGVFRSLEGRRLVGAGRQNWPKAKVCAQRLLVVDST
jgi:hypothetical protein